MKKNVSTVIESWFDKVPVIAYYFPKSNNIANLREMKVRATIFDIDFLSALYFKRNKIPYRSTLSSLV